MYFGHGVLGPICQPLLDGGYNVSKTRRSTFIISHLPSGTLPILFGSWDKDSISTLLRDCQGGGTSGGPSPIRGITTGNLFYKSLSCTSPSPAPRRHLPEQQAGRGRGPSCEEHHRRRPSFVVRSLGPPEKGAGSSSFRMGTLGTGSLRAGEIRVWC